jgi:glycosyltransferase involved in cell wall biosynthesis
MASTTSEMGAISEATSVALTDYEFIPAKRIQVIYNGIEALLKDPPRAATVRGSLGISLNDLVVGTVLRLEQVKNQRMVLNAFKAVLEQCGDTWLLMVGDEPERARLEAYAKELDVSGRVLFLGFQTDPSIYLQIMDIFLLSSFTEGTSMTLLEAMSLGVPSVVTRVGGNPEIIEDYKTGLTVPSDDSDAMARVVLTIFQDRTLFHTLSKNSPEAFQQRLSAATMAGAYQRCYMRSLGYL